MCWCDVVRHVYKSMCVRVARATLKQVMEERVRVTEAWIVCAVRVGVVMLCCLCVCACLAGRWRAATTVLPPPVYPFCSHTAVVHTAVCLSLYLH